MRPIILIVVLHGVGVAGVRPAHDEASAGRIECGNQEMAAWKVAPERTYNRVPLSPLRLAVHEKMVREGVVQQEAGQPKGENEQVAKNLNEIYARLAGTGIGPYEVLETCERMRQHGYSEVAIRAWLLQRLGPAGIERQQRYNLVKQQPALAAGMQSGQAGSAKRPEMTEEEYIRNMNEIYARSMVKGINPIQFMQNVRWMEQQGYSKTAIQDCMPN